MRTHLLVAILSVFTLFANAQDKMNRPTSYNYQRGVEAIQKENTEDALEYLNKEIEDNPKNGYAFSWIAMLTCHQEEYGRAITAAGLKLKVVKKGLGQISYHEHTPHKVCHVW